MTEQPPSASKEALNLATRIRDRYHAPGNEHVLELSAAAIEIDRFAERICEQRVSAAVLAEQTRCARIANEARRKYRDMDAFIADEIYQDIRGATVGRAPADRPAPPSPSAVVDYTTPDAPPSSAEKIRECSCHPDNNPPQPCPRKFAYSECMRAAAVVDHQAAFERLLAVHAKVLRDRADDKTALMARLREPETVEAVRQVLLDIRNGDMTGDAADAALAVIMEKLEGRP